MSASARRVAAPILAVLASILLLCALLTGYARNALFDPSGFADRATAALDDKAVRAEVAKLVTDDLVLDAEADLVSVRPVIESAVGGLVGGSVFQGAFRAAVRDVHRTIFEDDRNTVTLTIADIGVAVRGALGALAPQVAKKVDRGADAEVTEISPPDWVATLARVGEDVRRLAVILLAVSLALVIATFACALDRRRAAARLGVAIAITGVLGVAALQIAEVIVVERIDEQSVRDAVEGVWDAFLGDLVRSLYLFAAFGAVIAAAASSLLRPVEVGAALRRVWRAIATVPRSRALRAVRAVALLALGALVLAHRDAFVDLAVIGFGLYVTYAGVAELLRLLLGEGEMAARARASNRRLLIAGGVATGVIVVGGAIFIGAGGIEEKPQVVDDTGCNGSEQLCDRRLDEVAIPSTHNAMSAVTNPGWLFGQQDAGIPEQLADGIRGLFIDAHYGTPTEAGTVKTDLSDIDDSERAEYEASLGPRALDAALRIRDRIVDSPASGPRGVYLCHRFCELGALEATEVFAQIDEFVAAHDSAVLLIVIEDYVSPADIDAALRSSGLIDDIYRGPLEEPLPTLGEIAESGARVVLMAENEAGGEAYPYYHSAYDALVQETPYSFKRPALLTAEDKLDGSCRANRGPRSAPIFLLNHWIDTSPAPRPSNAEKVNRRDALMARIERCEEIRGLRAGPVSVDFYRRGDLFSVVEALNSRAPE